MRMTELGIVDIREIIRLIKSQYNYDLSYLALTSFKLRLEKVIARNNLKNPESLFRKLNEEPEYFDTFLDEIAVPSTEMFRDPSVWRWLREEYFFTLSDNQLANFKIWLPNTVSGSELFTLAIVLKELSLLEKVKIYATCLSERSIEKIKTGEYPLKKIETSNENYVRFNGPNELSAYYSMQKYNVVRDVSLIKDVQFIKDDVNFSRAPMNVKLILYRNAFIYFNPSMQDHILDKLYNSLSASGYLIIGLQEKMKLINSSNKGFELYNLNESIYKKKL
jgi:chemotaxis protein methyltransferase CheR